MRHGRVVPVEVDVGDEAGHDGEAMFRHACAMGLEGIVSKRVTCRYKSGSCIAG